MYKTSTNRFTSFYFTKSAPWILTIKAPAHFVETQKVKHRLGNRFRKF